MGGSVLFAPEAEGDVAEAYAWYEARRPGLGEEFLTCVRACLDRMERSPRLYAPVFQQ